MSMQSDGVGIRLVYVQTVGDLLRAASARWVLTRWLLLAAFFAIGWSEHHSPVVVVSAAAGVAALIWPMTLLLSWADAGIVDMAADDSGLRWVAHGHISAAMWPMLASVQFQSGQVLFWSKGWRRLFFGPELWIVQSHFSELQLDQLRELLCRQGVKMRG